LSMSAAEVAERLRPAGRNGRAHGLPKNLTGQASFAFPLHSSGAVTLPPAPGRCRCWPCGWLR
jgi:hypothetical protein